MSDDTPHGRLYVVATPLGNLEDLSPRASRTLAEVDGVLAEDTRRTRVLLEHLGLKKSMESVREHNERRQSARVIERLNAGERLALVSDAGTPAVSDPGARLVEAVAAAGCHVAPIPGPSALSAALSVAGFAEAVHDVRFLGFLAAKGKERREALEKIATHRGIVVFFESPHRIAATMEALAQKDASRPLCICRELTKMYEEILRGAVGELLPWAQGEVRGELTLVLGPLPPHEEDADEATIDTALRACLSAGLSRRDAAGAVAAILKVSKRVAYQRAQLLPE